MVCVVLRLSLEIDVRGWKGTKVTDILLLTNKKLTWSGHIMRRAYTQQICTLPY